MQTNHTNRASVTSRPSVTSRSSITNRQMSITQMKQEELLNAQSIYYFKSQESNVGTVERMRKLIWDPKTGKCFGRTGLSWSKIGLFYFIFYGMLAALVAICMWVFFQTLDPRIPRWQVDQSIIGTNPGMGFRPMPTDNLESTLIWLQGSNQTNYQKWVDNLMVYLDKYYTPGKVVKGTSPTKRCSYADPPGQEQVCYVDVRQWGPCSPDQFFNYHKNSPCIFLKLNRIYGWRPEFYTGNEPKPKGMPQKLWEHIRNVTGKERENIWVSCEGENPADKEYLGEIKYYPPIQGFPGYYYPYKHTDGYLSPLVAVHFLRPISGIVINVECKAWAKNIKHSRKDRMGLTHFELLIH